MLGVRGQLQVALEDMWKGSLQKGSLTGKHSWRWDSNGDKKECQNEF